MGGNGGAGGGAAGVVRQAGVRVPAGAGQYTLAMDEAGLIGRETPVHIGKYDGSSHRREDAPIGVLLTLRPPTREMRMEAAAAGSFKSERWGKSYPRIQIFTIADVMNGKRVEMPPQVSAFAGAPRETRVDGRQVELEL